MAKKRSSKSWYVKIKSATDEREIRVSGVTTPEDAMAQVTANEGEEVVSARPVRVFKPTPEVVNDTKTVEPTEPAVSRTVTAKVVEPAVSRTVTEKAPAHDAPTT